MRVSKCKTTKKKKENLHKLCWGTGRYWGACGNTAEGAGGRPVSDNLEKSVSKGKKNFAKRKRNILYLAGNVEAGAQTNNEKST